MKLYRAETGRRVDWQSDSTIRIETLEDLYQTVEVNTGIPMESQIIMTSNGNIVKKDNIKEVLESEGVNEYIVFCYDRDLLTAHADQVSALLDREIPTLEPEIPEFDGKVNLKQLDQGLKGKSISESCDAYVQLFVQFDSHSRSLIEAVNAHTTLANVMVEEQKLQSMALSVALANLKSHIITGSRNANQFIDNAKKELSRQSSLLKTLQSDIDILQHTSIHPAILETIEGPNNSGRIKLIDFVDLTQIETIRADTVDLCKYLNSETAELKKAAEDIVMYEKHLQEHIAAGSHLSSLDATLSDIKALSSKAHIFRDEVKKSLPRIYESISKMTDKSVSSLFENLSLSPSTSSETSSMATLSMSRTNIPKEKISPSAARKKFESFNHLAYYQVDDPLLKLSKCEAKVRQLVEDLMDSKKDAISEFFNNMKIVSELQDHIALLVEQSVGAQASLDDFRSKYGKNDLESVRQVLFAYGALLIEIVRRKEYIKILVKNSNTLADILGDYRSDEEKRRDHFRRVVLKSLPFKITGIDRASPQSEVSVNGANDDYDQTVLDKQDITDFISLLGTVYFQPTTNTAISRRPSYLSGSSSSSSSSIKQEKRRHSSLSPSITSKFGVANRDDNLLAFLNVMFKQMTDMRATFLKSIETNFFNTSKIYIDPSRIKEVIDKEDEVEQQYRSITGAKPYQRTASPATQITPSSPKSVSSSSSTFSVVEDDKKLVLATIAENNELKSKLDLLSIKVYEMTKTDTEKENEISRLKETATKMEQEKEELENHIQNLDQLVDNERQTFEQNRKSFLNELKNKDKSVDFRIASAEEDFQSKINDLQYALDEEKRMKKNLEIEHASELNTLQTEHASQIQQLKAQLLEEQQKSKDLSNEKEEMHDRMNQLVEDMANLKHKLETERSEYEDQANQLQNEMDEKQRSLDEIILVQQQTRSMVKRAQEDWEAKNEELIKLKYEQEIVNTAVRDLLKRFHEEDPDREFDLRTDIKFFRDSLEAFTKKNNQLNIKYDNVVVELTEVTAAYKDLNEAQAEWRTVASHMAEKLEEYRKGVVYELTQKLQLPMDEGELNTLSKNITPSHDDFAIWNQILHLASSIPTQKFVLRVLDHAKYQYDHSQKYKREYQNYKAKYNELCQNFCEKIAFRSFKAGDVALFLPTRNSSGKPWAAFNISAPHYFLRGNEESIASQMQSKEWIVARIVQITEYIADNTRPETNPYNLEHKTKYYLLDVENWRNRKHPHKPKRIRPNAPQETLSLHVPAKDSGLAFLSPPANSPPLQRPSFTAASSSSASNIIHSYVNL